MGIRIFGLQGCQWPYQGSRDQDRELLIFWICMWYMFICQFFNGYQNFEVTRVTKAISRFQVNNENGNPRDQDRELFIFFKYACDTSLFTNFSMGIRISGVTRGTKAISPLKNLQMNMYHMHIWKKELLPVLVPGVAILIVHLDPRHGFCHPWNLKIRIPIEKLAYEHVWHTCLK